MSWYIFSTSQGWAGIYIFKGMLQRSCLPTSMDVLMNNIEKAGQSIRLFTDEDNSMAIINNFRSYYMGAIIRDWEVIPDLSSLSSFSQAILKYVFSIPYGETRTYGEVARLSGYPRAARAVGQVLKHNPVPLIIPCHRVIAANGLGGFSAPGGIDIKSKMLAWEKKNTHLTVS